MTREERFRADGVLLLTGYHPDVGSDRRSGHGVESIRTTLVPGINPPTRSRPTCRTCSSRAARRPAGSTGTIFIENGRFHGEQVAKVLAARLRAE